MYAEGHRVAELFGTLFYECTAVGRTGSVEGAFHAIIQEISRQRDLSSPTSTTTDTSSTSESITPSGKTGSLPKAFLRGKSTSPKLLKKSHSTLKLFSRSLKIFT